MLERGMEKGCVIMKSVGRMKGGLGGLGISGHCTGFGRRAVVQSRADAAFGNCSGLSFGVLVISLALLGLGASGTALALWNAHGRRTPAASILPTLSALFRLLPRQLSSL